MRRCGRGLVQRALDHRGDLLGRGGGKGAAARGIPEQDVGAVPYLARLPTSNRGLPLPVAARLAIVPAPSAVSSTNRARQTWCCGLLRSETTPSSRSRSPGRSRPQYLTSCAQTRRSRPPWESSTAIKPLGHESKLLALRRHDLMHRHGWRGGWHVAVRLERGGVADHRARAAACRRSADGPVAA